ncbi:MAG TPA: DUF1992 domain-containing protein [Herpetosiphonaceae bacterium]
MDDRTRDKITAIHDVKTDQHTDGPLAKSHTASSSGESRNLAEQRIQEGMAAGAFNNLEGAGKPVQARVPLNQRRAADLVEQRIMDAMDEGVFDNLPGAGKPIDLYDDVHIPPDLRMAYRIMKGQQLAPPWIEIQKEHREGQEQYRTWFNSAKARWSRLRPEDREKTIAELRRRVNELNIIIHNMNAAVPIDTMRAGLLVYERELRALQGQVAG